MRIAAWNREFPPAVEVRLQDFLDLLWESPPQTTAR